jgi:hypothetical protein
MREKVITLKSGSSPVKIYSGESRGNPLYTAAFYHGGMRVRRVFADLKEAREEARALTDKDKAPYIAALEAL